MEAPSDPVWTEEEERLAMQKYREEHPEVTKANTSLVDEPEFEPVAFDVQGMKIGHKLTEELSFGLAGPALDKGKGERMCYESIEIGRVEIMIIYQFYNWKLIGVRLSFESEDYDTLIDAYSQKFGCRPHMTDSGFLENRLGTQFQNEIAIWETTSGPFRIEKYSSTVTKGQAILENPEYGRYLTNKKKRKTQNLSDQL